MKKFNLEGNDGWNVRKMGRFTKIWAALRFHGKTDISFVDGKINAGGYQELF